MTAPSDLTRLQPAQRAQLIYASARARTDDALWRNLMNADLPIEAKATAGPKRSLLSDLDLDALFGPRTSNRNEGVIAPSLPLAERNGFPHRLGPNSRHAEILRAAASRTGLPASALAAIVDAESAKRPDGSWNVMSRNPRSSAAGLGQFLSGTWTGEAQRSGTWLNRTASERGWLDSRNQVLPAARGALLALRYDPDAAIHATADYARANLQRLEKAGVDLGQDSGAIARAAYLGHHLGPGDAARFLAGGLTPSRAAHLLEAQVGAAGASRRIAAAGCPATAHRQWLLGYVDRHIRPDRFTV